MKRTFLFASLLCVLISTSALGVGGNMGGTDPNGSPEKPYLIEDVNDFDEFASNSVYWAAGVHTKLTTNIDLSGRTYTRAIIAPDTNNSIYHFQGIPFVGNFDGNNHIIGNFTITGKDLLGLFGHLGETNSNGNPGAISNLGVVNFQITGSGNWIGGLVGTHRNGTVINCYTSGSVIGTGQGVGVGQNIGGLTGFLSKGEISDCHSSSYVEGYIYVGGLVGFSSSSTVISSSFFDGYISGKYYIGGLVGKNRSDSISCFNNGSVNGYSYVGGLVGCNDQPWHITERCYNNGLVNGNRDVGGLVGRNFVTEIFNCFNKGTVIAESQGGYSIYSIGGLVGSNALGDIRNTYSTGEIICNDIDATDVGGLVGNNTGNIISSFWDIETSGKTDGAGNEEPYPNGLKGLATSDMQMLSTFTHAGWDFVNEIFNGTHQIWQITTTGGYPVFSRLNDYIPVNLNGDGTSVNPYIISNVLELGAINDYNNNAFYRLENNIDLENTVWNTSIISNFNGVFDGNGKIIENLNINGSKFLGLFGNIGPNASILGLGLDNVAITGTKGSIGSLAGGNDGQVINCYSKGNISGIDWGVGGLMGSNGGSVAYCHSIVSVRGEDSIGGLVGSNAGNVTNCYSVGAVDGYELVGGLVGLNDYDGIMTNCYSNTLVSGTGYVGGLVGMNGADWSTDGGVVTNCYSTGSVGGTGDTIGGMVGINYSNNVTNCFWDVDVSGKATSAAGMGITTTEMQTQSTFTGWDFDPDDGDPADWKMLREDEDYPRLAWQAVFDGDIAGLYGVDMVDFARLASQWGQAICNESNSWCQGADIDHLDGVDIKDLAAVAADWLMK